MLEEKTERTANGLDWTFLSNHGHVLLALRGNRRSGYEMWPGKWESPSGPCSASLPTLTRLDTSRGLAKAGATTTSCT